jgi:hypothetical protein
MPAVYGPIEPIVGDMFSADDPGLSDGVVVNDDTPATVDQVDCNAVTYQPVYDPNCPALVPPPLPPNVAIGCFDPPDSWQRYTITIPANLSALWTKVVPQLTVTAAADQAVRNMRVRFYTSDPDTDPCGFMGDLLISYVPEGGALSIDGVLEAVQYSGTTGVVDGSTLVFASDGAPFDWPVISCGTQIIVTIDFDADQTELPNLDLTLVGRENA